MLPAGRGRSAIRCSTSTLRSTRPTSASNFWTSARTSQMACFVAAETRRDWPAHCRPGLTPPSSPGCNRRVVEYLVGFVLQLGQQGFPPGSVLVEYSQQPPIDFHVQRELGQSAGAATSWADRGRIDRGW